MVLRPFCARRRGGFPRWELRSAKPGDTTPDYKSRQFRILELNSPETLSARAAFAQANALLRQTSRASNPDWYREGLDLDHQWHLVVLSGNRISSALLLRQGQENTWTSGPGVNLSVLPTREQVDALVDEIMNASEFRKARSLGVVIHLADEFATTEIMAEIRSAAALEALREEVCSSPATALGDPSLSMENTSTRLVPYAGAEKPPLASCVTLSRQHDAFVDMLRLAGEARNLPIQVSVVSAPLAFLSILPAFLQFQLERPQFVLLHYPKFSAMAVFNPQANLVQLRALPHRGRAFPGNLGDAVNTALDSLDLHEPVITILPLGDTDPSPLLTQLHATLNQPDHAEVQILRPAVDSIAPGVPELRPEMLVSIPTYASGQVSKGFQQLFSERWALQNFLPVSPAVAALYPTQGEMKMLRLSGLLKIVAAFALVGLFALGVFSAVKIVTDPAWSHNTQDTVAMKTRMAKATRDSQEFEHWENLLQERSKGWLGMELLARVFPENSGVKVITFRQNTRLDSTVKNKRVGFTREWLINGLANDKGIPLVDNLNSRESIKQLFEEIFKATGNAAFDTSVDGRGLTFLLTRSRNPAYDKDNRKASPADRSGYAAVFDLKITQSFPSEDPLALSTSTLPK